VFIQRGDIYLKGIWYLFFLTHTPYGIITVPLLTETALYLCRIGRFFWMLLLYMPTKATFEGKLAGTKLAADFFCHLRMT
jgi:hypothetical protein